MKEEWIYDQFSKIDVGDARLQKRAFNIAKGCAEHPEESLAGRFDEWADLKAAYRFFSNSKITHQALQQPHYKHVLNKACFSEETVLFIQDGSELLFNSHPWTHGLGPTADSNGNGLMFHSCLVAKYHESKETEILGLGYQEVWVRSEKKLANDSKESEVWLRTLEKIGRPYENWVSVGDRANDIYNFLHNAHKLGWKYVVRARHDRKVEINGKQIRLFSWIRQQIAKCAYKLNVKANGEEFGGEVELEITWVKTKLISPGTDCAAKEQVTYIRVWCQGKPQLEWLLITNLPVNDEEEALKIVGIYRKRWLIEDYHKVVKTGFRIEENQLKQASRIFALFGIIGILATQLLAMREHCRLFPAMPIETKVSKNWVILIERLLTVKLKTVRDFWRSLARLGGFIGRKSDGEPGWQTIWKGYKRLQDMLLGADLLSYG
jgi:Transposase DNA-binding/Transposase DDE domain/Transposase Tn5 dimerisation domain